MIIFDNMKNNQAIKMGENYTIHLGQGIYKLEDKCFNCGYSGSQVVVPKEQLNNIQREIPAKSTVIEYTLKDGSTCSVEDYQKAYAEWNTNFDEDGDLFFESLEQEYEAKKSILPYQQSKPVIEVTSVTYESIGEIEVLGEQIDTGSKFITSAFDLGMLQFGHGDNGAYKVDCLGVIKSELNITCNKNGWEVDIPSHSGIEYAKSDGKYLFTNNSEYKNIRPKVFAKLQDAKDYESILRTDIRKAVCTKCSKKDLSDKELGIVYSELSSIRNRVINLDVKRKDESSQNSLASSIYKLMQKLETEGE